MNSSPIMNREAYTLTETSVLDATACDWIEGTAAQCPHAVAVAFGEQSLTFRELMLRSGNLAAEIVAVGVKRGDFVAVALPRSADVVTAILGIFIAGGVYVPLDPMIPDPRLIEMLRDAKPKCLIKDRAIANRLPFGGPIIFAGTTDNIETPTSSRRDIDPDADAYVMYTSGSAGVPKGVVIQHRALLVFLRSMAAVADFGPGRRHLAITRTTFDISLLEILLPLCRGGQVVIAGQQDIDEPHRLMSLIKRHKITSLQATPSYLRAAIQQCPGLTDGLQVLVGGEPLPADLARDLLRRSREVWNVYGPTEATIWASAHRVTSADVSRDAPRVVTIGKPLANYRMYILDGNRQPVAQGSDGELYIAGPALAKGYLRRSELTNECFIPDVVDATSLMYRTGDVARGREDGNLDFLGRRDQQVKIHGVRLELGDVESALRELPEIREAVAMVRESASGEKELVAYVVPHFLGRAQGNSVRRELSERVPAYMVPSIVCQLDSIPLTPHGKTDYKALPDPEVLSAPRGREPETAIERRVCSIFAEIVKIEKVGLGDNFFDLGGDSLSGMRLVNHFHREFGVNLTLRTLFNAENVAVVVGLIREVGRSNYIE